MGICRVLGLATAYLLSVLIVSEYYPASDEKTIIITMGPLVHGVATSVQNERTKDRTKDRTKERTKGYKKTATHELISKATNSAMAIARVSSRRSVKNHRNDNSF